MCIYTIVLDSCDARARALQTSQEKRSRGKFQSRRVFYTRCAPIKPHLLLRSTERICLDEFGNASRNEHLVWITEEFFYLSRAIYRFTCQSAASRRRRRCAIDRREFFFFFFSNKNRNITPQRHSLSLGCALRELPNC